ncbi:hypothetical protein B5M09_011981, partial [Aphanomyces astaci]
MRVSACMDVFTKKRVSMWDIANRDYRCVTEIAWAAWFSKAFEEEPQDLEVLKKRLTTAIRSRPPRRASAPEHDNAKYERKRATCLKCGSANHKVVNCPKCAPGESERLLKEQMDKWKSARNKKVAKLQGITNKSLRLRSQDRMQCVISPKPSVIQPYGQAPALKVDHQVQFTLITLDTHCGPLALRGLKAWVDSSSNAAELLISQACQPPDSSDECGDDGMQYATPNIQVPSAEDADGERNRRRAVVETMIQDKLRAAEDEGLTADLLEMLRLLLAKHRDIFHLGIGHDEPIKAEPLRVRIKPGVIPVKCVLRRYPPAHVEFLKTHVRELEAAGLVYHTNRATWAVAPRIVPKKGPGDLRMTIDSRPINACTSL